ncbi:MAG: hypothetical protein D8M58_18755 [Calditrichaeota bacterium]|nr:MAG: hypothetical protein DWQ03_21435 [Calditrichota bacterium]MBL1207451.1 hypothetical protein [Calditrichota bacterium]NOG47283.1 hypothetical protein [Calditrichota bacterium]
MNIQFKTFLMILLLALFAVGQDAKTVTATGFGAILAGDMVKAKEDGTNDALRKAVEQVVGTIIDSRTVTENFMLLEDKIYTKTTGYVQSYEVISTNKRVDNSLEVTVRAIVKTSDLKNDIEGIITTLRREGMPRTMVLIKEENFGKSQWHYSTAMNTAETALMNSMMEYGFPFVDAATAKANVKQDALMAALSGDAGAGAAIAKQNGAEILIIGNAKTTVTQLPMMRSSGMKTNSANMNLRVVRADDAMVIATSTSRGVMAHIDEMTGGSMAMEKAAKKSAEDLKNKVIEKFRKNQYEQRQIQFQVTNITSFDQLNTIKNSLPYYVRGVKNIYQRSFGAGSALFDIEITQKAETVASELSAKNIEGIDLEITGVTQNKLTARIVPAEEESK